MADLRFGDYGNYYGSPMGSSVALSESEMEANARYIYRYLTYKGWTDNAIAGLLGNLEHESSINPGRWEGNNVGSGPGYGLVQWTPYTNHTAWCRDNGFSDYSTMDANLSHINYEYENGGQYYSTDSYPENFKEFSKSTKSPYYLACAFAWNYERSWVVLYGSEEEKEALRKKRGESANKWYTYLSGMSPPGPDNPSVEDKKRKGFNFVLFNKNRRFYG